MKTSGVILVLLAWGWLSCHPSSTQPIPTSLTPLQWASDLVSYCSAANTAYQYGKGVVRWKSDTSSYQNYTDCSEFLNALFSRSYHWNETYFKTWLGVSRPLAFTYYDAIKAQNHLLRTSLRETPTHLRLARQLVGAISADKTNYQHGKSVVSWKSDTSDYQCHTDCSGFLNALFRQSYGWDKPYFKTWLGANRPYAYHYFDAITAGNGFTTIHQINNIQPGDIIAIKYVDRSEHDSNTGHCMLVADTPHSLPSKPLLVDGTNQYEVRVIDSSKSPHGNGDTRRISDNRDYDGLGQGNLRLYADNQGRIVGYSWSTQRPKEGFNPLENPVVIGRLTVSSSK